MAMGDGRQPPAKAVPSSTVTIEVLYFTGCPHAAEALALVRRCAARLALGVDIVEHDGDYASPSVRVNGCDVMGETVTAVRACRRDVPTERHVMDALQSAIGAKAS